MALVQIGPIVPHGDQGRPDRDNVHRGQLSTGCAQCRQGAKLVVFLTGLCSRRCYYCPLSEERWQHDRIYANEAPVGEGEVDLQALIAEAEAMGAAGTGITGGDPMEEPERVLAVIGALKAHFGPSHHIHLYTTGRFATHWLERLAAAGLDELRFHPPSGQWDRMEGTTLAATIAQAAAVGARSGMAVGLEVPAIPGSTARLLALLRWAQGLGIRYCNLNELEFSVTNFERMQRRSHGLVSDEGHQAQGSRETALEVVATYDGPFSVHFCTSGYKDAIQLRQRFSRRAQNTLRPLDQLTDDDTLYLGVIEPRLQGEARLQEVARSLCETHGVAAELVAVDAQRGRVEVAWWVLEVLAPSLDEPCYLVEEHPTAQRLEVEREPLGPLALAAAVGALAAR